MKRLIITEDEKRRIVEMHNSKNNRVISEQPETAMGSGPTQPTPVPTPPATGATEEYSIQDLQAQASAEGVTGDVAKFANPESPVCKAPMTGDPTKDNYLKQIFNWAKGQNIQTLKNELKNIRQRLRDARKAKKEGKLQEQVGAAIVIAGTAISASVLIAIGVFLIVGIIILIMIKSSKGGPGKGKYCKSGFWDNLNQ